MTADTDRGDSGLKPAFLLVSGRMVAFAVTFFIPVVLARIFSQAAFGTYKQVFLIYSTLYLIVPFGMAESLFYFLPAAGRDAGRYLANSMAFLALAGLAALALLFVGRDDLARWLSNAELANYTASVGLLLLLMMTSSVLEIALIARRRYRIAAAFYGAGDVVRAVLFLAPAVVTRRLDALLAGAIAFAAMRVAVTFVVLARSVGGEHRLDSALLKRQLAYAVPFGIAVVVGACQANLHQYVVSHKFDAATFAVYSVGCLQVPIVDFLMTSAGNVLMVRMTEDLRHGRTEHLVDAWLETVRHLALVLIPLVALLIATADRLIVLLFTERYAASVPVFRLWTLAILLAPFMTDAALRVYAETRFLLFLNTVQLAVIGGLLHWSIATWQLPGAVVVTLAAAVLAKTLAMWRVARRMQVAPAMLAPWRTLAGIAMASTLAAYAARLVVIAPWLPLLPTMILQGAVFGIVYLSCAWQSDWLTANERFAITSRLQRVTGSVATAEAP